MPHWTIRPARADEWFPAFQLVFRSTGGNGLERAARAVELIRQGEFSPNGIMVAEAGARLMGVVVCLILPGASALVWPPRVEELAEKEQLEDDLLRTASAWLKSQGVCLSQTLLEEGEDTLAVPLLRNGFQRITTLGYLRHDLRALPPPGNDLRYEEFAAANDYPFRQTLERTYEDTLDCPELNGQRSVNEILAGHQGQGSHVPARWWLAYYRGEPAGVLLLAAIPEWRGWDLSYLGVIPAARGKGLGGQLACKALHEARNAGQSQLTLSVDLRNTPACMLYDRLGFVIYDRRLVYLALWPR